jgi:thiamine monophosphate synthase
MFLPRIYPITEASIAKLSHAGQVERLIEGGATFIQLREKSAPMKDFFADAAKRLKMPEKQCKNYYQRPR